MVKDLRKESDKLQNLGGVGVRFYLFHYPLYIALFIDDECGTNHSHGYLTAHLFFLSYAEGFDGLQFRV